MIKLIVYLENQFQKDYYANLIEDNKTEETFNVFSPFIENNYLIMHLDTNTNRILGNSHFLNIDLFIKIKKAQFYQIIDKNNEIQSKYISTDYFKFKKVKYFGNYVKLSIVHGRSNYNNIEKAEKYEII